MQSDKLIQQTFLEFAIECGALQFGEFRLKSKRISPYFFNTGIFATGSTLKQLGWFYASVIADRIQTNHLQFDMIFGSAYKGIPLACATAIALHNDFQINKPFAFDRKETKDHGEGGDIVGTPLNGRILIIDDVISAGITINHSCNIIRQCNAEPIATIIAFDREEIDDDGQKTSYKKIGDENKIDIFSIATLSDLINLLEQHKSNKMREYLGTIKEYQSKQL